MPQRHSNLRHRHLLIETRLGSPGVVTQISAQLPFKLAFCGSVQINLLSRLQGIWASSRRGQSRATAICCCGASA